MDKNKNLLREGLEKALEIIERHLEIVKKDSKEVAAGMLLSQTLILEELGNLVNNNDDYDCSVNSKNNIDKDLDKMLYKLKMDITNQGTFWYGTTVSNKVFKGKYQYGILEITIENGAGYYGEHGDEDDFIIDTEDMLYYSGFQIKK